MTPIYSARKKSLTIWIWIKGKISTELKTELQVPDYSRMLKENSLLKVKKTPKIKFRKNSLETSMNMMNTNL